MKTTSCSTHKKVSTILLYIYFTRKPVNIQDLYFPRRKDKILRLARSGRGLGQRPISAISVHIMSGRGARRESPSLFLRPAHRGSEGECTEVGAGQLFRSKCFRQSACGFMKDLWAGWLRANPSTQTRKGSTFANRCKWVHLMLDGVFFYHRHPCIWQFLPARSCIGQRDRKIACVIICPQGDGILAASKDRKSEKKG